MPDDKVTQEDLDKAKVAADAAVTTAGDKAKVEAEDKGLSPEEVQVAVEKARKEEKDKLYPQLKELKESFAALQKHFEDERAEKLKLQKDAEKKADEDRVAKLSDQERTNEVLSRLEEQLKNERLERESFKRQLEERDKSDILRRYKEKLVEANKGEIIPELIQGRTEEELDNSVEIAKARFKELEDQFKLRQGTNVRGNMPRPTNPDTEALEELEISKDLTAVDSDKYLKDPEYRNNIKKQLEQEYARLAGRY